MLKPMMRSTDPTVKTALDYLQSQVETNRRAVGGDMSIRIYRMVEQVPLTIEQYWAVADIWLSWQVKLMKEQREDWLLVEAWQRLTDWTPTGTALLHLVDSAPAAFHGTGADFNLGLLNTASWLAPAVSWSVDSLTDWMGRRGALLSVWSDEAICRLPGDLHDLLLADYLKQSYWHACLNFDEVQMLIDSGHWSAGVMQAGIEKYMNNVSRESDCTPQTHLILEAWLETLLWTPDTAGANIVAIDKTFKSAEVWLPYIAKIGQGLKCLSGAPAELQKILSLLSRARGTNADLLQAQLSSAAGPVLSERDIQANLKTDPGCILMLLSNPEYSVEQRLGWLRNHSECLVAAKRLAVVLPGLESPLREGVALACVLQATSAGANKDAWKTAGVSIANTAGQTKFLNAYAPELKSKIATVRTLDISFQDALDMYLDDSGYLTHVEPGVLPSFGAM